MVLSQLFYRDQNPLLNIEYKLPVFPVQNHQYGHSMPNDGPSCLHFPNKVAFAIPGDTIGSLKHYTYLNLPPKKNGRVRHIASEKWATLGSKGFQRSVKVCHTEVSNLSHLEPITKHQYIDPNKCLGVPLRKHTGAAFICLNLIWIQIFSSSSHYLWSYRFGAKHLNGCTFSLWGISW